MTITATYKIAHAAGQDAGNASMRKAKRSAWNAADWNVASETMIRIINGRAVQ